MRVDGIIAGPGAYDPKALAELGFKPDPKSGFVGSDRFLAQELTGEAGTVLCSRRSIGVRTVASCVALLAVSVDARPPSAKPESNGRQAKPQASFGRSASSRKKVGSHSAVRYTFLPYRPPRRPTQMDQSSQAPTQFLPTHTSNCRLDRLVSLHATAARCSTRVARRPS
jgi:hypothetical protein